MKYPALAITAAMIWTGCTDSNDQDEQDSDLTAELAALQGVVDALEDSVTQLMADLAAMTGERDELAEQVAILADRARPAVSLEVPLMYGDAPLALDTPYPLPNGADTIRFAEVRYWLTNVALRTAEGAYVEVPGSYYLVEARPTQLVTNGTATDVTLPALRRETIQLAGVEPGRYRGIRFHIGVDPAHNDDLSQSGGELHTLKNMTFDNGWMWFTSYVFTKTRASLDGAEGAATLAWDNGSNDDYRTVELDFPADLMIEVGAAYVVRAPADLQALVAAVAPRAHLTIGASSPADRTLLADGFRDMFAMASARVAP